MEVRRRHRPVDMREQVASRNDVERREGREQVSHDCRCPRPRAVAADYAWAESDGLFSAYCLTLVQGVTPQGFMDRLGARTGFDVLRLGEQFTEISFDNA